MLAQFKPALAINPAIQANYAANRLRVVRQVCHSPNNPNEELDLVLFLNGIPVTTSTMLTPFHPIAVLSHHGRANCPALRDLAKMSGCLKTR
ncbi:MAG TPA: hypothetical protein VJN44_16880 [Roseateles sp.]|nr:hypothetical protein [Roseateles sp.]